MSASLCKRFRVHDRVLVLSTRALSSASDSGSKRPSSLPKSSTANPTATSTKRQPSSHPLDASVSARPSSPRVPAKSKDMSMPPAFQKTLVLDANESRAAAQLSNVSTFSEPQSTRKGASGPTPPLAHGPSSTKRPGSAKAGAAKPDSPLASAQQPPTLLPYLGQLKKDGASEPGATAAKPPVFPGNRYLRSPPSSVPASTPTLSSAPLQKSEDPSFVYNFGPMKQTLSLSESFFGSWSADPPTSFLSASDRRLSKYERESLERKRLEGRDDMIELMPGQSYDGVLARTMRPKSQAFSKEVERAMNRYDFTVLEELFDLPAIASSVAGSLSRQTIAKLREFQMPVLPQQIEESLSREFFTFIRATNWQAYRPFRPSFPEANRLVQELLFYEMGKRRLAFQAAAAKAWAAKVSASLLASPPSSSSPSPSTASSGSSTLTAQKKGGVGKGPASSSAPAAPAAALKAVEKKPKLALHDTAKDIQARRASIRQEADILMKEMTTGDYARHGQPSHLLLAATGSPVALDKLRSEHPQAYQVLFSAARALGTNPSLHPSMKADSLRIIQDILISGSVPLTGSVPTMKLDASARMR